ncbi:MAG: autotransporter outer membrane beta-barrel domain-containing protein [Granulosicoccus sp.]
MNRLTLTLLSHDFAHDTPVRCFISIRNHCKGLCKGIAALIALLAFAPVGPLTGSAAAQESTPQGLPERPISIQRGYPGESTTVVAGSTLSGIFVARNTSIGFEEPDSPDTSFTQWYVEPGGSGSARIITPVPVAPMNRPIEVEFLQPGTVTLIAFGYDNQDGPPETDASESHTAVFNFTVVSASEVEQVSVEGENTQVDESTIVAVPLGPNARTALATINLACSAANNQPSESATDGQLALASSCALLNLQEDPTASLDRLVPEEFFAIGDALTTTSDNQISNIRKRINTVRAGQPRGFDIRDLNLRLWDQTVGGSVLDASKNALANSGGGAASQDPISSSALGLFANGNIAVGSVDGNGIQHDASISTNSLTVGADYRLDGNRVIGAALGVVNDTTDFTGDNGDLDMQGVNLSAFATWYEHDSGHADLVADFSRNSFDLTRRINLTGQTDEFANSSTDATRMSLSINAGRTFNRGNWEFGPVARITLTRATIDGFSETSSLGATGAGTALDVKSHTQASSRFSIGGEIQRVIGTPKAVFVPSLRMELQNESETDKGVITASFSQDPDGNQMQIEGTRRDSSALFISVGATMVFAHAQSAFVFFETRAKDDFVRQNLARAGYRVHF